MVFDLVLVNQDMSPEVVAQISLRLGIPRNFMFISCPPEVSTSYSLSPHVDLRWQNVVLDIAEYGGLRIITH
eukprot:373423-Hanusia_phi.AAC.1